MSITHRERASEIDRCYMCNTHICAVERTHCFNVNYEYIKTEFYFIKQFRNSNV